MVVMAVGGILLRIVIHILGRSNLTSLRDMKEQFMPTILKPPTSHSFSSLCSCMDQPVDRSLPSAARLSTIPNPLSPQSVLHLTVLVDLIMDYTS